MLITARTLSHSVQSMERYHEEYFRLGDKHSAIIRSYISLYAPAMVSIVADGLAIMTIAVATIPLMRKLAFVASLLDHLDLHQRRHAAPDHPQLRAAAEGAPHGQPVRHASPTRSAAGW